MILLLTKNLRPTSDPFQTVLKFHYIDMGDISLKYVINKESKKKIFYMMEAENALKKISIIWVNENT